MKWLCGVIAILLTAVLGWLPFKGADVATLEPVETLYLYINKETIRLETDEGWFGEGETVADAVFHLEETTPGKIFLETVDFLIINKDSVKHLPELLPYLRLGCGLCVIGERPDLSKAGAYLRTHSPRLTLGDYRGGEENIPELIMMGERGFFVE